MNNYLIQQLSLKLPGEQLSLTSIQKNYKTKSKIAMPSNKRNLLVELLDVQVTTNRLFLFKQVHSWTTISNSFQSVKKNRTSYYGEAVI